jgi:hypothetical protein
MSLAVNEAVNGCERRQLSLEDMIIARLEDAGRVFLALPDRGPSLGVRTGHPDVVHEVVEAYGYGEIRTRVPVPSSIRITRMEMAFGWVALIPNEQHKLRRIVLWRMLVHPLNDRHMRSWRVIGRDMGIDHNTAQRWHDRAICIIATELRARSISV